MEALPSFQALLDSTSSACASTDHPFVASDLDKVVGPGGRRDSGTQFTLSDVGSSPFFSSSFFSSSSSFFSSSGELCSLLASTRQGTESPVPSSPVSTGRTDVQQQQEQLPSTPATPLRAFLSSFTSTSATTSGVVSLPSASRTPSSLVVCASAPSVRPRFCESVLPPAVPSSSYNSMPTAYRAVVLPLPAAAGAATRKESGCKSAGNKTSAPGVRTCTMCGTTKTKQWRSGSDGKPSLCNACGLRYRKDSLGQKFKFKQVVICPGSGPSKKRKQIADKNKQDSVDETDLTASLAAAKGSPKKRRHNSVPDANDVSGALKADAEPPHQLSGEGCRKSDIYSLLN